MVLALRLASRSVSPLIRAGRRLPWARILIAAKWLYERGKDNLTQAERRELGTLLKKTKGDPRKLNANGESFLYSDVIIGSEPDVATAGQMVRLLLGDHGR